MERGRLLEQLVRDSEDAPNANIARGAIRALDYLLDGDMEDDMMNYCGIESRQPVAAVNGYMRSKEARTHGG